MTGYSHWFGILAGVLTITAGVYSLLRTSSVASWLASHGVQHPLAIAASLRQVKTLGVLFILGVCREYVSTSLTLRWRYIDQRQKDLCQSLLNRALFQ
jgi:hypothetical protein